MNSDDPKFTAHVLGECEDLTAAERAEIEALITSDPAAASEAAETRALAARLRAELPGEAAAGLEDRQRAAVLKAAAWAVQAARVVPFPRRTTALAAIAASLVVGVTAVLVFRDLREAPVGNLPVLTKNLSENPVPIATANVSSPKVIPPLVPSSLRVQHAQQVQFGNITLTKSGDDHVFTPSVEIPGAPQLDAMVLSCNSNNSATIVDAGTSNVATGTFVSTTATLNYPVDQRIVYPTAVNGFETGAARFGGQAVTIVTSTIQTTTAGSLSFYTGSTVTIGSISASSGVEHPAAKLARRDRGEGLAAADAGERVGFDEATAGKDYTGAVFGALGSNITSLDAVMEDAFLNARENPVSTFGIDVSTGSYAIIRRFLDGNQRPPEDAVRIEELLNYFTYDDPPPQGDGPFAATMEVAECPWAPEHRLVRIGLKARENPGTPATIARDVKAEVEFNPAQVGAYRLIGYEKRSVAKKDSRHNRKDADEIAASHAVTALYELVPAGKELPPLAMLDKLKKAGVEALAAAPVPKGKVAPQGAPPKLLIIPAPESEARVATPQLLPPHEPKPLPQAEPAPRDGQAELLPPHVPSPDSVLRREPEPKQGPVTPYLLEQESRGTVITAAAVPARTGHELLTLKLRYKAADGDTSRLLVFPLTDSGATWDKSSPDFRFAAAVASFGMLLRDSDYRGQATWQSVAKWAREGLGSDVSGHRREFLGLVEKARAVSQ